MENGSAHCDACTVGRASAERSIISCDKCNPGQFAPFEGLSGASFALLGFTRGILMLLLAFPACLAGMDLIQAAQTAVCVALGTWQTGTSTACQNRKQIVVGGGADH